MIGLMADVLRSGVLTSKSLGRYSFREILARNLLCFNLSLPPCLNRDTLPADAHSPVILDATTLVLAPGEFLQLRAAALAAAAAATSGQAASKLPAAGSAAHRKARSSMVQRLVAEGWELLRGVQVRSMQIHYWAN